MQKRVVHSLKSVQDTYSAFSTPQKLIAGIGVALLVLGGFFFMRWASTPTMVPLYSNLSGEDAQAITSQLDASGVQYALGDNGTTVLVPQDDVPKSRMDLAAQGLPGSGSKGWSIFDNQPISSTSFQQQVSFQRALQGELNKSIGTISGVKNASVTLALPKDSVFAQEKNDASASVVVQTYPGKALEPRQVQAISHLVSEAVVSMEPENVTVVDADGNLLTSGGGMGGAAGQVQAERSGAIRASVQALLDKVVGPGNSIASVQMEMSQGNKTVTEKQYTSSEEAKPRNSKSRIEKYEGSNLTATGPLGEGVQGPDNIQVAGGKAGGANKMDVTEVTENNALDEKITHTKSNGGEIERVAVSVAVDEKAAAKVNLEDLQNSIAAAAMIDKDRGDVLSVTKMAFDQEAAEQQKTALAEAEEQAKSAQMMEWIRTGAIALAIIILAIVALVISRRNKDEEFEELAVVPEEEPQAVETTVQETPAVEPVTLPEVEGPDPAYDAMREDIADMVDKQPDEVAELLRGWLADRRS